MAVGLITTSPVFAAEVTNYQNFELDTLLHGIDKPGAPIVTDDYIIFTADTKHRFVGIVFDFDSHKNKQLIINEQNIDNIDDINDKELKDDILMNYQNC